MLYSVENPFAGSGEASGKEKVFLEAGGCFSKLHSMCSRSLHSHPMAQHHSANELWIQRSGVPSEEIQ